MKKVSYQGVPGAYSESAARKFFGEEISTIGCFTFKDALISAVPEKSPTDVNHCILPVENSIEGTVGQSIDEIVKTNLHAIGEVYLKVEHCLIGRGKLDEITKVYSHPQALGQCSDFIENHHLKTVPTYDTAGSVEIIKDLENNCAAIASSLASNLYDVPIIKEGIANNSNNFTRFLIFSKENTTESKNDNPMISIFNKSMIEWLKLRNSKVKEKVENRLNNVLISSINNEIAKLEKNMIFLASLGSAAPFVGLFGTVWGIMNSFQAIGITKNTSLAVVAPGIAEALFATALGLIAAIPAVLAYNKISSVFDNYSIRLETFAQEFVNRLTK